jgi:hypothetical protein
MATWSQVESVVKMLSAEQLNDTMWSVELSIGETGRTQLVYVMYELIKPDMEFVKASSPLDSALTPLDIEAAVREFGSLTVGSLSYMQFSDGSGMLFIGTTIPLRVLDLSDPHPFLLYLQLLAQDADWIKQN